MKRNIVLLLGTWTVLFPALLRPASIAVVLADGSGPYGEALAGLKGALGDVEVSTAPDLPDLSEAKVVVTFGSAAAALSYPGRLPLVAAMLGDASFVIEHSGSVTKVGFTPQASALAAQVKALDPNVDVLGVIDPKGSYGAYVEALKQAAGPAGFSVDSRVVGSVASLGSALPAFKGKVQAIYIPPDPLLMNSKVFGVLTQFCHSTGIGLFAPVLGLEKAGAFAAVAPSYSEIGRAAAAAAKAYLAGQRPGEWVYSSKAQSAVNSTVAAGLGVGR